MIRERLIELGGCATRSLEVDGDGPPFVLLHGFSDSADTWRPLLDRLRGFGRRSIAIDLPGFGVAADAQPGSVLAQFDAVVIAALERAGGGGVLVGNSMGGLAALHVANGRLAPLAGVVPVCTAGLHHPRWISALGAPVVRSALSLFGSRPLRGAATRAFGFWGSRQAPTLRDHLPVYLGHLQPTRIGHQISIVDRLLAEGDYPLEMGSIECPTLFVWGADDRAAIWSRNSTRLLRMAEGAPGSRSEVLAHCGHTPQLQAPDRFAALLSDGFPTPASVGRHTDVGPPSTGRAGDAR